MKIPSLWVRVLRNHILSIQIRFYIKKAMLVMSRNNNMKFYKTVKRMEIINDILLSEFWCNSQSISETAVIKA